MIRAAVLTVLLAASAAVAEQELPTYPGAVHTRIGSDLVIGGEYYRLAYFTTSDSMATVAKYFERFWRDQGYPVTTHGDFKQEGVVSAFYTREGLQRSVVLRMHQGKVVGFTTLRDLWKRAPKANPPVQLENTLYASAVGDRTSTGTSDQETSLVELPAQEALAKTEAAFAANGFKRVARGEIVRKDRKKAWELEHLGKDGQVVQTSVVELEPSLTGVEHRWSTLKGGGAKK